LLQTEILNFLFKNNSDEYFPVSEIARQVKSNMGNVSKQLNNLEELGLIERQSAITRCSWRIKKSYLQFVENRLKEEALNGS